MSKAARRRPVLGVVLAVLLVCAQTLAPASVHAQTTPTPGSCTTGTLPHGALSLICIPATGWNGDLMVWAHGYVAADQPLGFYYLVVGDNVAIPLLVQALGFAFAATSYRQNGLAILEGVDDVRELVAAFNTTAGRAPTHTYLAGASEGGLVAALSAERSPTLFNGVLAACGPVGDFPAQIDYIGDFRVLFDYFFPGVIPGSPVQVPQQVRDNWETFYVPTIVSALATNPAATRNLAAVSGVSFDSANAVPTFIESAVGLLWYSAFATNDATARLGGNPYDNRGRIYHGSSDDQRLNAQVVRVAADPGARANLAAYTPAANPPVPVVTLHTTGDPIIPVIQTVRYVLKAQGATNPNVSLLPVSRYGHCAFTAPEALLAFLVLVARVTGAR